MVLFPTITSFSILSCYRATLRLAAVYARRRLVLFMCFTRGRSERVSIYSVVSVAGKHSRFVVPDAGRGPRSHGRRERHVHCSFFSLNVCTRLPIDRYMHGFIRRAAVPFRRRRSWNLVVTVITTTIAIVIDDTDCIIM